MASRSKRAKATPKKHIIPFILLLTLGILVGGSLVAAGSAYALVQSWLVGLPNIDDISQYNSEQKTRIYAADGTTLLAEFYEYDRTPVSANKISQNVFDATVAVEDERFWQHGGVDFYGIARALVVDLTTNRTEGASTITQQLVRQTVLQSEANDMTPKRKVREAVLAQQLEDKYSKPQVLVMYLNTVNYGDGSWGIESAAQHYFSKPAADLDIAEAALLCGIPQSPEYNNPVTYPDNALARRNIVLSRMFTNGYIDEEEYNAAKNTGLNLKVSPRSADGIYLWPYATSFVRHELLNDFPANMVFRGGLNVYTSIDLNFQQYAEDACVKQEKNLPDGFEVSLTCVDPNTGYIKCMRGGKSYYEDQFNTCWQMHRQAGSSFKAFGLTAAIEKGYNPQTTVSTASPFKLGDWTVSNYSGSGMGTMTLARATWLSSNTAYARVVRTIGADAIVDTAHRMGITSDLAPYPSIVLGSSGVNTLEMASAFGTLATGGIHNKPTAIMKITDNQGNVLYEHVAENERVLTASVAYAATSVLRGVVQYGTGTAAQLSGRDIAGKTGTSDQWKDAWFNGFTPQLSTSIWVGKRDNTAFLSRNEGGVMSAPVWHDFMAKALEGMPKESFKTEASPEYRAGASFMTEEEKAAAEAERKAADDDKDGFTNGEEEKAGTDPNDPKSHPKKETEDDKKKPSKSDDKDDDKDGYTNSEEEKAGTDPKDPKSHPKKKS